VPAVFRLSGKAHAVNAIGLQHLSSFYVTGSTLSRDAPCYVARRADTDLHSALERSEFCYVLTARQMGRSSLMARTASRLRDEGVGVVVLDLTAIGQNLTAEQWYDGLLTQMASQLSLEAELEESWDTRANLGPLQRWTHAVRQVTLAGDPRRVVVFINEIDAVRSLPFSTDEFFAAIREFYSRRTKDEELRRLTFCLLGIAAPCDLYPRHANNAVQHRAANRTPRLHRGRGSGAGVGLRRKPWARSDINEANTLLDKRQQNDGLRISASQSLRLLSSLPVASNLPPGEKAMDRCKTRFVSPFRMNRSLSVTRSQPITESSPVPNATVWPSGENARQVAGAPSPSKLLITFQPETSQTLTLVPDGQTLVSAGRDGILREWRAATEEEVQARKIQ
jgi:hypothetical protein